MIPVDQYPQTLRDVFENELMVFAAQKRAELITDGYIENSDFDQYVFADTCHTFTLRALADTDKSIQKGQAFGADATFQEQAAMWKATLDKLDQARTYYLSRMKKSSSSTIQTEAWQQI